MSKRTMSIDVVSLGAAEVIVIQNGGEIVDSFDFGNVIELTVAATTFDALKAIALALDYDEIEFNDVVLPTFK